MTDYEVEATRDTLKGIVTCGARAGYQRTKQYQLDDVVDLLAHLHEEINPSIPCIIREGRLVGRVDTSEYVERVYSFEFFWSPRQDPIGKEVFQSTLLHYAQRLGEGMRQERVYIEYEGKTTVLKRS